MSVNKVILIGNVGKDPDTRHLEGGNTVSKFPLATSENYKNKNGEKITNTEWHNIVLWRGLAEIAEKYVRKGSQLYIEGRIRTRTYTDQEGNTKYITEIIGDSMQMLNRKSDSPSPDQSPVNPGYQQIPNTGISETGSPDPLGDIVQGQNDVDDLPF